MKIYQLLLLLFLIAASPQAMDAQRTTRTHLRPKVQQKINPSERGVYVVPDTTDFAIAGFNKPLNSTHETFLFTNLTLQTITELFITINYYDTSDRKLHRQVRKIIQTIPPGETLLVEYPSFDRQQSFYYHLSREPRVSATPFRVTIKVDSVRILKGQPH